tara:strand:+ start:232 stop:522 length:291 start_codon:yes stop_codon:yes gene_type:complete
MKKVLLSLVIAVIMTANVFADFRTIGPNADKPKNGDLMKGDFYLHFVCIDGYKFVVGKSYPHIMDRRSTITTIPQTLSVTQVFEKLDGHSVPKECN